MSSETGGLLVISPHLDDAVLSCGHWLTTHPGAVVATVCSGLPGPGVPATPGWDGRAFATGDEAMTARRAEDLAALRQIGATQRLLGFLDVAYRSAARCHEDVSVGEALDNELCRSIGSLIDDLEPTSCLVPLGIVHGDHIAVRVAALIVLEARGWCRAVIYADLPEKITFPDTVEERVREIRLVAGLTDHSVPYPESAEPKVRAVGAYRSQAPLLDIAHPRWRKALDVGSERFWQVDFRDPDPDARSGE